MFRAGVGEVLWGHRVSGAHKRVGVGAHVASPADAASYFKSLTPAHLTHLDGLYSSILRMSNVGIHNASAFSPWQLSPSDK